MVVKRERQGSLLAPIEGKGPDQGSERRHGEVARGREPKRQSAPLDYLWSVKLDLLADCLRYEDRGEVEQEVKTAQFVEVE